MSAAAITTEYVIDRLGQLASYENIQVERLKADLNYLNAFLKCAQIKDDRVREIVREIRNTVCDVDVLMDAFISQLASSRSKKWFQRLFVDTIRLESVVQKAHELRQRVESAYGEKGKLEMTFFDDDNLKLSNKAKDKTKVVGLYWPTNDIIGYLKEDTPRLDIITIVGMPGLGKSTLAGKILQDLTIQYEFLTRLWVCVSNFSPKDVFLSILSEFTTVTDEIRSLDDRDLAEKVKGHLERGRFLIVMDDVCSPEDWSKVSAALPTTNHLGKIIITSRYEHVASSANPHRPAYRMKLLEYGHSEELLQYEVFGVPRWESPEIEAYGKLIAQECKGLPLAIVVTGRIILKKISGNVEDTGKVWETFAKTIKQHLMDDPTELMDRVISWSYRKLPHHLKACFLYFGMFPEDIEIPTWMLFQMWIAEGFIPEKNFGLEENTESYLDELISRSLVMVEKRSSNGKVKTCRIHDSLHDFCMRRADKEGFFAKIRKSSDGNLAPFVNKDKGHDRLCIHSNISKFISSKPFGRRVRSFVCFSKEDLTLDSRDSSAIPAGFSLLRVLDMKPIKFNTIPINMYNLLHLRYIHLSFNSAVLPRVFSRLSNMQTLIVDTSKHVLEVKADLWKMRHLRHLKTNKPTTLPEPAGRDSSQDENVIQTLGTIAPENCTDKVLNRACNLRRVSIRGNLSMLLTRSSNRASFESMAKLRKLEKLKLQNYVNLLSPSYGQLLCLPPSHSFPPNLRALTLADTFLDWGQMEVLSSLDKLEVLKLKEKAFTGNYWETIDGGFCHLKVLFIGRTDLVVWKTFANHFPELERLELRSCEDLREVPVDFVKLKSFKVLGLNRCQTAAASAKEVKRLKMEADPYVEFSLTISPL